LKYANERMRDRENSLDHKICVLAEKRRGPPQRKIGILSRQIDEEIKHWRSVLQRVAAAVNALASRRLSFRGSTDCFGSVRNGTFVTALEFTAVIHSLSTHRNT
jgi:hypothetical protein